MRFAGTGNSASRWVFAACLALVLTIQILTGAYRVERGIYSDDAAHFMNGLVLRDYLRTAIGHDPMKFAEDYYFHYPKIAPLIWPPLFHVALGVFLLPGWPAGPASLVLVALVGAWLAWRLHHIVQRLADPLSAWLAVVLLVTTPLIQAMSAVVMLDLTIAAAALEAAYWLAMYAHSGQRRHAVLFGAFAAAACLTKGNGLAVVLMPVFFILLTGQYSLLRKSGLYIAAAMVLVLAAPILAISAKLVAAIGDLGPLSAGLMAERLEFFGGVLWTQLSPVLALLAIAGVVLWIVRRRAGTESDRPAFVEAMAALAAGTVAFHLISPHILSLSRYLTMAIAPVVGIAVITLSFAVSRLRILARPGIRHIALAAAMVAVVVMRPAIVVGRPLGFRSTVAQLASIDRLASQRVLIVSDEIGEGAFVSEVALLELHPAPTVVRGSKLLASDDWLGHNFQLRYESSAAVLADLECLHVDYVLLDLSETSRTRPYFPQVEALARTEPVRFKLVYTTSADPVSGPLRSLALYQVTSPTAGPAKELQLNLAYSLGRTIKR